jgi:hypothetical protein
LAGKMAGNAKLIKMWVFYPPNKNEVMVVKYEKYKDEDGLYFYELELKNGTKCMVPKVLGDYLHSLEQYKRGITL